MKTSDSALWRTLRFFQLHKVYRWVKSFLPKSVVNAVTNVALKNAVIPLVLPHELEPKYALAWARLERLGIELGDYLEFGVSLGTSMTCMHRVIAKRKASNVRLFGFDSFEGLPASAEFEDGGEWKPGQFASSIDQTRDYLNEANIDWSRTHLVKGWFDETLNAETIRKFNMRKASIIMIDCDIYSASKSALNFALPLIVDFTIIFFDDWRDDITFGEYRAFTEFLRENRHLRSEMFGEYRPTGRIFIVTNTMATSNEV